MSAEGLSWKPWAMASSLKGLESILDFLTSMLLFSGRGQSDAKALALLVKDHHLLGFLLLCKIAEIDKLIRRRNWLTASEVSDHGCLDHHLGTLARQKNMAGNMWQNKTVDFMTAGNEGEGGEGSGSQYTLKRYSGLRWLNPPTKTFRLASPCLPTP